METKYYKCVALDEKGNRVSYVVSGKVMYTYKPGVWTRWRRYGAFVFNSLEDVRYFLQRNTPHTGMYRYEVWECEVRDVRPIYGVVYVELLNKLNRNQIIATLNHANKNVNTWDFQWSSRTKDSPRGSFMASQIKLTNRVNPYVEVKGERPW